MFKSLVTKFFSTQYMFGAPNSAPSNYDHWILYFGAALVVAAAILFIIRNSRGNNLQKQLLQRWFDFTFYIGLLFALWYWLRYEFVAFLAVHFVALLILIAAIVWLVYILRYQFGGYSIARADAQKEQLKRKYM
jgi:energy-converting hydrogenase Eha subunit E